MLTIADEGRLKTPKFGWCNMWTAPNKERENGVGLREEIHPESWLWLLQMEGNSNPITIYPKLDISHLYLSDPQEDKQFNADPIHPKEELVDWTQKLITCYITIPSIPMKDISSFHVCLVSEKFSKFANDDLSFSILRLAVAAEWGMNKDIGFKMDAYCIYACACNIMLLVILLGAHSRGVAVQPQLTRSTLILDNGSDCSSREDTTQGQERII